MPTGKGWFILNARDAPWYERNGRGFYCEFEGLEEQEPDFSQLGINVQVLRPGEPMSMYHWEADQEDFLVVAGEAVAIVEGEERPLRRWISSTVRPRRSTRSSVQAKACASSSQSGATARQERRSARAGAPTVDEAAARHGTSVDEDTTVPKEAYARFAPRK